MAHKGIRRVILGTIAVRDPALVREACKKFPGRVAVGIDKGGKVAVEGWAETSELTAIDLAKRFEDAGVAAIIYTDIDRDGVLKRLNLPSTAELARSTKFRPIASGGLASIGDIKALLQLIINCWKAPLPVTPYTTAASIRSARIVRGRMKISDTVKLTKIPADLPSDNVQLQTLFRGCVGKTFKVAGFDDDLVELHVAKRSAKKPNITKSGLRPIT